MRIGLALRSTVYGTSLISKIVPIVDRSATDSVWFPSVGKTFDSLDMCGIALGETRRLRIGTGVIRSSDFDRTSLLSRVHTLTEGSGGRFVLGIGTGSGVGASAIERLVSLTEGLRSDYPEKTKPPIFFAALRKKILQAAHRHADGAILNFCSAAFVKKITSGNPGSTTFSLGCYVKLFFAEKDVVARSMLVDEIKAYSRIPQYRAMFEQMGISEEVDTLVPDSIPQKLFEISLANPTDEEVVNFLKGFESVGVELPIVYPYVSGDEGYKRSIIDRLSALA